MKLRINEGFNKDLYCIKNTNSSSPAFFAFKSYDENTNTAKVSYFGSHAYPDRKYNQDLVSDRFGRTSRAVFACLFDNKEDAERVKNIVSTSAKVRVQNVYNTELFSSDINKTVPINTKYGWCLISTDCPIYKQHKDAIDRNAMQYLRKNLSYIANKDLSKSIDINSFINHDYRKGSSNVNIPSAIEIYDGNLAFEFEDLFNKNTARQFVDDFINKNNLKPTKVDVLDFTEDDEDDPYDDKIIGVAVVCRFD